MDGVLKLDIETHSADLLYSMSPEEFVRLIGYQWGTGDVVITTSLDEIRDQILKARWIVGHNIHAFDLKAIFGTGSDVPLELTMQGRVFDAWTHATLVNPAPYRYTNRFGKGAYARKPDEMMRWFALDEQAHQLGVEGKTHDLKALAKKYGGFGQIPITDEDFRAYLVGDVLATGQVAKALLKKGRLDKYALREQEIAARAAIISSNGLRVDTQTAQARVDTLRVRREEILSELQTQYGLPTEGKSPWATKVGKEAIMAALADHGITPENTPNWTLTATGNISLGGDVLIEITKDTDAEELGQALAELKGQRSLAQLALDSTHADEFVHPDITMLQRSGRWSTTKPGLTVWTSRGKGSVEKSYFLPDTDDEVLLEIDYSQADARIVAAFSGDTEYAKRFEPGADGHMINAIAAWGQETVDSNPKFYRQAAKAPGHGWNYSLGAEKAGRLLGETDRDEAIRVGGEFIRNMSNAFPGVTAWKRKSVREAEKQGYILSEWGRKLWVEQGREFTQGPALIGQNGTREIVCDALLTMSPEILRKVKAQIHDALLFSVPKDDWENYRDKLAGIMQTSFKPRNGGQEIDFPVSSGPPGNNWQEAGHD